MTAAVVTEMAAMAVAAMAEEKGAVERVVTKAAAVRGRADRVAELTVEVVKAVVCTRCSTRCEPRRIRTPPTAHAQL